MEKKNRFTKEKPKKHLQPMTRSSLSFPTRMMPQRSTGSRKELSLKLIAKKSNLMYAIPVCF